MAEKKVRRTFTPAQIMPSLGELVGMLFPFEDDDVLLDWGSQNETGAYQTYDFVERVSAKLAMTAFIDLPRDRPVDDEPIAGLKLLPDYDFAHFLISEPSDNLRLFVHGVVDQSLVTAGDEGSGSSESSAMKASVQVETVELGTTAVRARSGEVQDSYLSPERVREAAASLFEFLRIHRNAQVIAVMGEEMLFEMEWYELRRFLVDEGLLDTVILLPDRLLRRPFSNRRICLVKIGGYNDDSFAYCDARAFGTLPYKRAKERTFSVGELHSLIDDRCSPSHRVAYASAQRTHYLLNYASVAPFMGIAGASSGESGRNVEIKPLEEVVEGLYRGFGNVGKPVRRETNNRLVSIADFENGKLIAPVKECYVEDSSAEKRERLRPGDVVVSRVGKNMNAWCITPEMMNGPRLVAGQNLLVIRAYFGQINPEYLAAYLSSVGGKRAVDSFRGGAQGALSLTNLKRVLVPVPGWKEQERIAEQVKSNFAVIDKAQKDIEDAQNRIDYLFDALNGAGSVDDRR